MRNFTFRCPLVQVCLMGWGGGVGGSLFFHVSLIPSFAAGEASASLGPVGSIPKASPTWAGTVAAMPKLELCPGGAEVVSSAKR